MSNKKAVMITIDYDLWLAHHKLSNNISQICNKALMHELDPNKIIEQAQSKLEATKENVATMEEGKVQEKELRKRVNELRKLRIVAGNSAMAGEAFQKEFAAVAKEFGLTVFELVQLIDKGI